MFSNFEVLLFIIVLINIYNIVLPFGLQKLKWSLVGLKITTYRRVFFLPSRGIGCICLMRGNYFYACDFLGFKFLIVYVYCYSLSHVALNSQF